MGDSDREVAEELKGVAMATAVEVVRMKCDFRIYKIRRIGGKTLV